MSCDEAIGLEALVDYFCEPANDADAIEDHLFECDDCAKRLEGIASLMLGVKGVVTRRGGIDMVVDGATVKKLEACGLKLRHYRAKPGDVIPCTVGPNDDLLVSYLSADLEHVDRADVVIEDAQGNVLMRIDDAPIDRSSKQLIYTLGGDRARTFPAMRGIVRILVDDRSIADYVFDHTPGG